MIPTFTFFRIYLCFANYVKCFSFIIVKALLFPSPDNHLVCFTCNQQTSCSYLIYFYILASCSLLVVIHDVLYSFMMTLDSFPGIYLYSLPKQCVEDSTILTTLNF